MIETPELCRAVKLAPLFASLLLLATSWAVAAETTVYVWTSKDGVVTYSQDPPSARQAFTTREITTESLTPAQRALRESMMAAWFVERAIQTVDALVTAEAAKRRAIDPVIVRDLATFLKSATGFARTVITLRVAGAFATTGKRRGR